MSIYIFDTSSFSVILKNYYEDIFPTFWEKFDELIIEGKIISVKEVKRELEKSLLK